MFGSCALRLRQCLPFARKRGVLSRRSADGSGSLVARHRQVHAPCEAGTGNGLKRRSAKEADRDGVLGYKGARRKRLAQRSASRGRRGCEPPNMSNTHRGRMTGYAEVILVHSTAPLLPACRQCARNSTDCALTDVRRVFIEVSYDGLRQAPANVEGTLRDPAI